MSEESLGQRETCLDGEVYYKKSNDSCRQVGFSCKYHHRQNCMRTVNLASIFISLRVSCSFTGIELPLGGIVDPLHLAVTNPVTSCPFCILENMVHSTFFGSIAMQSLLMHKTIVILDKDLSRAVH